MKFIKVIYFDESSVADFMQIMAGGEIRKTTEFISNVESNISGNAKVEVDIDTNKDKGLPKLFSLISGVNLNMNAKSDVGANYRKDKIVKNILENTLLADFLEFFIRDQKRLEKNRQTKGIKVFNKISVYPEYNSFTFLMLASPYLSLINGEFPLTGEDGTEMQLDISKIEAALDKGRGYYEFISKKNVDNEEVVLRFNISAFRNNYTLSDLPKMQLTYYAIYVGTTTKIKLNVESEFEFGARQGSRVDYTGLSGNQYSQEIKVYDVLMAGVIQDNE